MGDNQKRILAVVLIFFALAGGSLACNLPSITGIAPVPTSINELETGVATLLPTSLQQLETQVATLVPTSFSALQTQAATLVPNLPTLDIQVTLPALPGLVTNPTSNPNLSSIQIDGWTVRYDSALWQPGSRSSGDNGRQLLNKKISGCILEANLGFGPPDTWKLSRGLRVISGQPVSVETWTDTRTNFPVLIVYENPPLDKARRIELMMSSVQGDTAGCVKAGEQVIADSLNP